MLERGPHVDPRHFDDDEVVQYLRLYNEGALQLATDFSLQVLQGMCVGGGTTINNALCLHPPELVLEQWEQRGLDRAALKAAIEEVRTWFDVAPIRETTTTEAAKRFGQAVGELDLPGVFEVMEANISAACRATGYCNIGCGYGAKLSTLDTRAAAGAAAVRARPAGRRAGRADRARGHARDARRRAPRADRAARRRSRPTRSSSRPARSARATCSSAAGSAATPSGATCTSTSTRRSRPTSRSRGRLLRRDPDVARLPVLGRRPALPGRDLVQPARHAGARHARLVRPPLRTTCSATGTWRAAGVLVGTTSPGRVKAGKNGPEIEYTASAEDRGAIVEGLQVAGRIWLEAGAERVMPATFAWQEYRTPESLAELPAADPRVRRPAAHQRAPAGRQRARRGRRRGLPRARARQPLPLRRQRVPHQRAREPAAHGDGDGAVRGAPDRRREAGDAIIA